jgi:hypothetical protein
MTRTMAEQDPNARTDVEVKGEGIRRRLVLVWA